MDIPILFEDDALLVVNKPPGVVVNRAQSVKGETVQDWMEMTHPSVFADRVSEERDDFVSRSGVVHRLDKETSGCLILAKTPESFLALQKQFADRVVKKTYRALVHGKPEPAEGQIEAPVGRLPWNRERFGILPGGKPSITRYTVVGGPYEDPGGGRKREGEKLWLVECYPQTGRTHQIRVHLQYINHPIVADYLYAGRKTARADRTWAPRVLLHAMHIEFTHPLTGQTIAVDAPLFDDMMKCIKDA